MAINLYLGDCMDVMAKMPDKAYDLAIVDPEYGIKIMKQWGQHKNGYRQYDKKEWDNKPPSPDYFTELFRVSKNQIIWGGNYFWLPPSQGWAIWDKGQRDFSMADAELAWTSFDKAIRIFDYSRAQHASKKSNFHPTEKPVALYKWLLKNYAKPGDKIIDTHFGSLSIGIACHDLGFDLDAWELDPDYFAAAHERLRDHMKQAQLFNPKEILQPKQLEII